MSDALDRYHQQHCMGAVPDGTPDRCQCPDHDHSLSEDCTLACPVARIYFGLPLEGETRP